MDGTNHGSLNDMVADFFLKQTDLAMNYKLMADKCDERGRAIASLLAENQELKTKLAGFENA